MQLRAIPESPLEWLALRLNKVPLPLLHGQMFPVISKAVLVAADRRVFNAIEDGNRSLGDIAKTCGFKNGPASQLLQVLSAAGYLVNNNGEYRLTDMSRKWALFGSASDLSDLLVYNNRVVWRWMEHLEDYLVTGKGIDYHSIFGKDEWNLYQKAMLAVARSEVDAFSRKCPVPEGAALMLDIGGAHGLHVGGLQRRYPDLQAHILDLPGAWEAQGGLENDRIEKISGSILDTELTSQYDFVLMSSLAHHFSAAENVVIAAKVAAALRPGGVYVVNEFVNPGSDDLKGGLVGASSNLFFGLTSTSGTWTIAETQEWMRAAGLKPFKVIAYTEIPGRFQIAGRKE